MYPDSFRRAAVDMLEAGYPLNSASRSLGVSRAALRFWRDNGDGARAKACPIEEARTSHRLAAPYSALLGYYLGDGCISSATRTTVLRIACDRRYAGIVTDIDECIRTVHPERPIHHVAAPGVIVVQNAWKHWPCLFPQHGPGRKHARPIVLEPWQQEIVREHPFDLLRGRFHSDGCRVANWATRMVAGEKRRYDYPRWQFVNRSEDILHLCTTTLDLVDIPWRRSNKWTISVSRRAGVAVLDEMIGLKC